MIRRRKKQPPVQRAPHISRQKQTTFHYSSNRSQVERTLSRQNQEEAEKDSRKGAIFAAFSNLPYILGGIFVLVAFVYFSLLTAQPKVVIRGVDDPLRSGSPYAQSIAGMSQGLQSRSKFTLDRQKITGQLQAQFPELRTADVVTPLFANSARVEVEISQPVLVLASGNDTFLLDNRGIALLNTARERLAFNADSLPIIADQSNIRIEVGKQALTSAQVAFVLEISRQSEAKGLEINEMDITSGAGELVARYVGTPYTVKFNFNEDARKSFGTFYATREYLERDNKQPAEYIDVRIPERAYVK